MGEWADETSDMDPMKIAETEANIYCQTTVGRLKISS
jgi:hypothetical protein